MPFVDAVPTAGCVWGEPRRAQKQMFICALLVKHEIWIDGILEQRLEQHSYSIVSAFPIVLRMQENSSGLGRFAQVNLCYPRGTCGLATGHPWHYKKKEKNTHTTYTHGDTHTLLFLTQTPFSRLMYMGLFLFCLGVLTDSELSPMVKCLYSQVMKLSFNFSTCSLTSAGLPRMEQCNTACDVFSLRHLRNRTMRVLNHSLFWDKSMSVRKEWVNAALRQGINCLCFLELDSKETLWSCLLPCPLSSISALCHTFFSPSLSLTTQGCHCSCWPLATHFSASLHPPSITYMRLPSPPSGPWPSSTSLLVLSIKGLMFLIQLIYGKHYIALLSFQT